MQMKKKLMTSGTLSEMKFISSSVTISQMKRIWKSVATYVRDNRDMFSHEEHITLHLQTRWHHLAWRRLDWNLLTWRKG